MYQVSQTLVHVVQTSTRYIHAYELSRPTTQFLIDWLVRRVVALLAFLQINKPPSWLDTVTFHADVRRVTSPLHSTDIIIYNTHPLLPRKDSFQAVTLDCTDMLFIPTQDTVIVLQRLDDQRASLLQPLHENNVASQQANTTTLSEHFTLEFRILGASLLTESRDIVNVRGMPMQVNIKPLNDQCTQCFLKVPLLSWQPRCEG